MASLGRILWKWLATTIAVGVIILAILVGLFRVFLPQIPEYHTQIEAWASQAIGREVHVSRIDARWRLDGPELVFEDAEVMAPDGSVALIRAETGSVGISLISRNNTVSLYDGSWSQWGTADGVPIETGS